MSDKPDRISFNGGASFWEYSTPERLAEIMAFVNRVEPEVPFCPSRCVEASLEAERAMFARRS